MSSLKNKKEYAAV